MNKKEVAEIKKQFKVDNYNLTIHKICNAYITCDGNLRNTEYLKTSQFALMPEIECDIYMENCKKLLSGQLGKGLIEFNFPTEAYEETKGQHRLYELLQSELNDEDILSDYITYIVQSLNIPYNFYITIAYCTYNIPSKDNNEENIEDEFGDGEVYNFIMLSINEASLTNIGLFYNPENNLVEKKNNVDMEIVRAPQEGILFPVFNDRMPDINSVLYYTKTPKKPNEEFIENVLNCNFTLSSEEEKEKFTNILTKTLEDDLDYELLTNIHQNIREVIQENSNNTELPSLNKSEIKKILKQSGVTDERLESFDDIYEEELDDLSLKPINMIDTNKLDIKAPDIKINIKPQGSDKVSTQIINNRKCIVIEVDDSIEVNGLSLNS